MRLVALASAALVVAVTVGCGSRDSGPDLVNGKRLFVTTGTCGSCHTLARAGTKGTQGPNLDDAFSTARRNGLGADTIEGVVRGQIDHPRRGSIMPAKLVKGDDARDVAAYVAYAAGRAGKDAGQLAQVGQQAASAKPAVEQNGTLTIAADPSGALRFATSKATARAGQVTFVMPNKSPVSHDIAIKGGGVSQKGAVVGQGGTSRFTARLKPGTYEFYCSVPGHEQGGMKGTLTVK
ncbi:MAG: c-type cytochrome [Thermoleophilaceae bacterium]|nr:c-type cytochrome [Thermoleophilaceae bacterium]